MTYLAHRLTTLMLLASLILIAGCKSAAPAPGSSESSSEDAQATAAISNSTAVEQIDIPTPEPTPVPEAPKAEAVAVEVTAPVIEQTVIVQEAPAVTIEPAVEPVQQTGPAPLWSLKYPKSKESFAGDLAITVIQDKRSIKLTNRTTKSFHDVLVWVNQQFVSRVQSVPVGQTTDVPLKSLMNQYGEKYPVPGLFRPDRSFPALLVEIVEPDQNQRYRLIVQKTHSQF